MKTILFSLCLVTVFASCKEPSTPPSAVLDGMFTAMKSGNTDDMKKFITKSDAAMLEAAEAILTQVDSAGVKKIKGRIIEEVKKKATYIQYSLKNEKIDGDHATVEAEIIDNDPGDSATGKKTTHTFELVKEDNAWKIELSKPGNEMFNSMKGNMGARKGDLKTGLDKLNKMDKDTLKMMIEKGAQALDSLSKKKAE